MPDEKTDGTLTARSSEPVTRPYEVGGLSSRMKEQLSKSGVHPSVKQKITEYLVKIKGG